MTSSAKFYGTSVTSGNAAYFKSFNQSGLNQGPTQPWIYTLVNGIVFLTTAEPVPILLSSTITTGNVITNGQTNIVGNTTISGNLVVVGSISTLSDEKKKKDIHDIHYVDMMHLTNLHPIEFKYTTENNDNKPHFGFIAQEVEQIYPHIVSTNINDNIKTINYNEFIPLLVAKCNYIEKKLNITIGFIIISTATFCIYKFFI